MAAMTKNDPWLDVLFEMEQIRSSNEWMDGLVNGTKVVVMELYQLSPTQHRTRRLVSDQTNRQLHHHPIVREQQHKNGEQGLYGKQKQ